MSIKLKKLKIKNFKCFAAEKTFDLAKLTILTGGNSSGKTSVLHAILGAVQSGEFPLKFSPNGKYINMGDFKEISNKHLSKDISLSYTFKHKNLKSDYLFETVWRNNKENSLPLLKSLTLSAPHFYFSLKKSNKGYLLNYSQDPAKDPDISLEKQKENTTKLLKNLLKLDRVNFKSQKKFDLEIAKRKKLITSIYKKATIRNFQINNLDNLDFEVSKRENLSLIYTVNSLLEGMWGEYGNVINAISSFRNHPDRTYLEQSKDKLKVDKFGDGYLDQIILWERRKSPKYNELIKIMRDDLSLLYSLKTNREIGGGRYEVLVKTKKEGIETSLFDVGFGVNQFLPIIVADLQLGEGSTLFIAEPEIHLHPNVQARFADYVVKQIEEKKKNYIIETHSEYFLNRIRLAIVNNNLKEQNLSVYFLENNGGDTDIHKLNFTKKGSIENAPKGFFDTYMMDLKEIAFNA